MGSHQDDIQKKAKARRLLKKKQGISDDLHAKAVPEREPEPKPKYKGNRKEQRRFLDAYMQHGVISQAARDTGINIDNHYRWIAQDESYRLQFAIAQDAAFEIARAESETAMAIIEPEMFRQAIVGDPRKLWHKGEPIIDPETGRQAVEYRKVPQVLIRLAEAYDPKYRNSLQVIQQTGVSIQQVAGDVAGMAGSIPPPDEAVQAALRARIVEQLEHGPETGGNGNGNGSGDKEADQ